MTRHLSTQDLAEHRARTLTAEELARLDAHLFACDSCHKRFVEFAELRQAPLQMSVLQPLDEGDALSHLSYEEFAALVDGTMGEVEREIADGHMLLCSQCADEFKELRAFSRQIFRQPVPEIAVASSPTLPPLRWRAWFEAFRPLRAAAMVITIVLVVGMAWIMSRKVLKDKPSEIADSAASSSKSPHPINGNLPVSGERKPASNKRSQIAGSSVESANTSNTRHNQTKGIQHSNENNPRPEIIIALNDGERKITLDRQRKLVGLESLPPATQQAVKSALLDRDLFGDAITSIMRPMVTPGGRRLGGPAIGGLIGTAGTISAANRGSFQAAAGDSPFQLISPTGVIVSSAQPTLNWQPLEGATGYLVVVYNEDFTRTAASEELSTTQWVLPHPLLRGRIYSWQVIALKGGSRVMSHPANASKPRFKILEEAKAREIDEAGRLAGGSHLALGVIYAQAGLVAESEREFRELVKKNPASPIARQLLRLANEMQSRIEAAANNAQNRIGTERDTNQQSPSSSLRPRPRP
jgi:hypothetical protein